MPRLILASTSPYRRQLLERLQLPFATARPQVDESPLAGEAPAQLAARLALAKAQAIAGVGAHAWTLGSDQVAELDGIAIGKPGNVTNACAQLTAMSGRKVRFHTAICLSNPDGKILQAVDVTEVQLRALTAAEIARYVQAESPLDCAGSFKCEGLGITLFESIQSQDPTALIGLPLIALAKLLRLAGFQLP
jgi:septum formation protein